MSKIDELYKMTEYELEYVKKEMEEEMAQCKRYAELMLCETDPLRVWDTADTISRAGGRLQAQMRKLNSIREKLALIDTLRQG